MYRIIMLSGPQGCGKDTVASALTERFGGDIHRLAEPLKQILFDMAPIIETEDEEFVYLNSEVLFDELKRTNSEVRHLAQALGEGARKILGKGVWTTHLMDRLYKSRNHQMAVVPDVRFPDEIDVVKTWFNHVYHIHIKDDVMLQRTVNPWAESEKHHDKLMEMANCVLEAKGGPPVEAAIDLLEQNWRLDEDFVYRPLG